MENHSAPQVVPPDKAAIMHLWKVAGILLLITIFEFAVAFLLPHSYHLLRVAIFVGMTIVKAFYIVFEFMHLRYEVRALIWVILLPLIFLVWLLIALLYEGFQFSEINFL